MIMAYSTDTKQTVTINEQKLFHNQNDIRTVEISFEEHKIYIGTQVIAKIIRDDSDFATQPWVVMVNGIEIHRANTWTKCYHYITWHFKQGTLPEQQKEEVATDDCKRVVVPVFVPNQRLRQVALISDLALYIYFKCIKTLRIAIDYLLLFEKQSKFCRSDC